MNRDELINKNKDIYEETDLCIVETTHLSFSTKDTLIKIEEIEKGIMKTYELMIKLKEMEKNGIPINMEHSQRNCDIQIWKNTNIAPSRPFINVEIGKHLFILAMNQGRTTNEEWDKMNYKEILTMCIAAQKELKTQQENHLQWLTEEIDHVGDEGEKMQLIAALKYDAIANELKRVSDLAYGPGH